MNSIEALQAIKENSNLVARPTGFFSYAIINENGRFQYQKEVRNE
jgi:hypothetical protein